MRGLGARRNRNLTFTQTDSNTGVSTYIGTVFTDGPDFASWNTGPWSGAMAVPAAWRAATLISGLLGTLPLTAKRKTRGRPDAILDPQPLLLTNPAPGCGNAFNVRQSWALDYLWHGNCIGIWASVGADGWPTAILPVPVESVQISPTSYMDDYGIIRSDGLYRIGNALFTRDQVFHVRGPSRPGDHRGMGVLESALTFQVAREQDRQASGFGNSGVPTGVLQTADPDVTTAELSSAKTEWLTAQGSAGQSYPYFSGTRTIAALPPGVTFTPISWNPEEMQMIEARKFSDVKIAQLFGLPLRYVAQEVGGLTYSSPGADGVDLLKFTMNSHLVNFEQEWARMLPRGVVAEYDRDAIMDTDPQTRTTIDVASLAYLTKDEVRAKRGYGPAPTPEPVPAPAVTDTPTEVVQ